MYFYSKKTNGFYIKGLHVITDDMKKITQEYYEKLMYGQSNGKQIAGDESGYPILLDQAPSKNELIKKLVDSIDNTAANLSAKWTRFAEEYKQRESAAIAFKEAGFNGGVSIYISSFATVAGLDNKSATLLILKQAESLRELQAQLAVQRMRKYELKHEELSEEELQQIHDDIIRKMKALAEVQQ